MIPEKPNLILSGDWNEGGRTISFQYFEFPRYRTASNLDVYIANIALCSKACPDLTGPHLINVSGRANGELCGFNIADIIIPLDSMEEFFSKIEGRVSRYALGVDFVVGTVLIEPRLCEKLPLLDKLFKETRGGFTVDLAKYNDGVTFAIVLSQGKALYYPDVEIAFFEKSKPITHLCAAVVRSGEILDSSTKYCYTTTEALNDLYTGLRMEAKWRWDGKSSFGCPSSQHTARDHSMEIGAKLPFTSQSTVI